jgi:zinc D-Ala-D-Ala carboxypeptidase
VGNAGAAVKALQTTLSFCYDGGNLAIDGIFGPNTRAVLEKAQTQVHVTPDGVYGPQTRNALHWISAQFDDCKPLRQPLQRV